MNRQAIAQIDGVFLAVKCISCGAVHPAESEDYVGFWGGITIGLDRDVLDVTAPRKPKKRSMVAVCRTPECMGPLVRDLLVDASRGDVEELWTQAIKVWAGRSDLELVEVPPSETPAQRKRRAQARKAG